MTVDDLLSRMATQPLDEVKSRDVVRWRCPVGLHGEFDRQLSDLKANLRAGGMGCQWCNRSRRAVRETGTLADSAPLVASMLLDADPTVLSAGSSQVFTWRCLNDPAHTFTASVNRVTESVMRHPTTSKGCPHCKRSASNGLPTGVTVLPSGHYRARKSSGGREVSATFADVNSAVKWRESA